MNSGDVLVMIADGVLESPAANGTQLGSARLGNFISGAPADAEAIIQAIKLGVTDYTQGAPLTDDETIIVIRFG